MSAAKLPPLVWTPSSKVGAEALIYFNRTAGYRLGSIVIGGTGGYTVMPNASCAVQVSDPIVGNGFVAAVLNVLNRGNVAVVGGDTAKQFPITTPFGSAFELEGVTGTSALSITGSVTGDQIDLIALPDPANDILICYDQGIDVKVGDTWKPIPRKFAAVDHYVRQRPENSLTIKDLYVCNWEGLRSIAGFPVTIIVKIFANGGAVPSEIQYYTNVRLSIPPIATGNDANASLELSGEAKFENYAVFGAQPTYGTW